MIRVIGDRVLVALPPSVDELVSPAGIVLVKDPDRYQTPTRGIVVQLGEKSNTVDLDAARSEVHTYFIENFGRHCRTNDEIVATDINVEVDRILMRMQPAPFDVQVSDCVLFSTGAGEQVEYDGIEYVILREAEILGIVEPITQKEDAA